MQASGWQGSRPLWSSVAIVAMWMTVLAVGLFGGDIHSQTAASWSSVPACVAIVPFAFVATIFVARWGLRPASPAVDREAEPEPGRPPDPCSPVRPSVEAPDAPHAPRA